jgi:hypothetical protein
VYVCVPGLAARWRLGTVLDERVMVVVPATGGRTLLCQNNTVGLFVSSAVFWLNICSANAECSSRIKIKFMLSPGDAYGYVYVSLA